MTVPRPRSDTILLRGPPGDEPGVPDFGAAILQKDPKAYLEKDFAALMETMALASGMKLESENKKVPTGLE